MSSDALGAQSTGGEVSASSAGELLRQARLSAGVHIESIAFSLKVPVTKIEALERDDLEALPDAVFARALASSVCRTLKIDAAPVLALLPRSSVQLLPANDSGVNAAFRDGSERLGSRSALARASRPLGLMVVVLLIGAGVLAWMPSAWLQFDFANTQDTQPSVAVSALPPPVAVDATRKPIQDAPVKPETPEPVSAPAMTADAMGPASFAAKPTPTMPGVQAEPPVATATPRLTMTATGETWVQVKDAQGAILLERILRSGETASLNQPGRLSVVVGRADVTDVRVAGEKLDIAPLARENVARFEVKP